MATPDDFIDDIRQLHLAFQRGFQLRLRRCQQLLQVLFKQSELPQRDRKTFRIGTAFPCVQLNRHKCAGDVVSQMMGETTGHFLMFVRVTS